MNKVVFLRAASRRATPVPTVRRRTAPICVWTRDPGTGRLSCRWRSADAEQDIPLLSFTRGRPPSRLAA